MPSVPCKSLRTHLVRGEQRPIWHKNKAEVEACPFCRSPPAPTNPATTESRAPGAGTPPAGPDVQVKPTLAIAGPQPAAFGSATPAEVLPTSKGKKDKTAIVWDGYLDAPHVRILWNDVLFFWVRNAQLALDKFVFKVEFHIPDKLFAISPFADKQLDVDVRNLYTIWGSNLVRLAKPKDLAGAQTIVEDAAMLSSFAGLFGAFASHYTRIYKESPILEKMRARAAARKAKLAAMKEERERKTREAEIEEGQFTRTGGGELGAAGA